ncbi:MAG: vWA domain-containing protein [Methyloligellaceae bacterium]
MNADSPQKAMLVLDASGSMWGKINGEAKIDIARDTIKKLLSEWDPKVQVGLSAYGHRRKGDCRDIETLFPVGPAQKDKILNAVNTLQPKGKTPLSDAVRQAALELKYTENKATVILISDGKETCHADPCQVGKALEALGIDFTVHVVGFDIKKSDAKGLQCLAKNTGGLYLPASNAGQLKDALTKAVKEVKVIPKPIVKKVAAVKPGHYFQATLKEGSEPLKKGMRWDIYFNKKNINGKRKHVTGNYNAKPSFKLKAGNYLVIAKYGNAIAQSEFSVKSVNETVKHTVVLNAGSILLKAALDEESSFIERGIRWDIYKDEKVDLQNKRKHVNGNYNATPVFHLNTGKYHIVVKRGNAVKSAEFEVGPGERKEKLIILNAGLAFFKATFSDGGKEIQKGLRWDIYSAKKDLEGKRKHINGNYNNKPWFTLPVGKYHVVTKRGNAVATTELAIEAGKRVDTTVNMNAGLLAVKAILTKDAKPEAKGMRWDVYHTAKDENGKRQHINGNYNANPTFTLGVGKYHVVAKNGNAITEREVEIKAEERNDTTFDLNAGRVKLVALDKKKKAIKKGLRWDIYTSADGKPGKHVNGNYNANPIFTLNTGYYIVKVKIGNSVTQHKLDITPGMSEQVEISIE